MKVFVLFVCLSIFAQNGAMAQRGPGYYRIEQCYNQGDSIPLINIVPIYSFSKPSGLKHYDFLVRTVKKVHPLSKLAKEKIEVLNTELEHISTKADRRKAIRKTYDEIIEEYTPIIRRMTRSQGIVLMKLIERETNERAYDIVKEFKGGFTAGFWQGVSRLFGQDLKSEYDKNGEDWLIEQIIIYYEAGLL